MPYRAGLWVLLFLIGCEAGELRSTESLGEPLDHDGAVSADRGVLGESDAVVRAESDAVVQDVGGDSQIVITPSDASTPRPDGAVDPCTGGCGVNAHCAANGCACDRGFVDSAGACVAADPCDGIECGHGGQCLAGECECLGGFVDGPGGCVPADNSPLELRTEQEVCARWASQRVNVNPEWTADTNEACEPGVVPDAAQANAIRRVNLFRWLVGLNPVVVDVPRLPAQQACAVVMVGLGGLSHHPPENTACYTPAGAGGAGSSNIAQGAGMAHSVDLYVADPGANNAAVGHRRWMFNPSMGKTAFGYKPPFSCMYSFDGSQRQSVDFVSWPPPGYLPANAARGRYSVHFYSAAPGPDFSIEVAEDGGAFAPVEISRLAGNYGRSNASYTYIPPSGSRLWAAGHTMRVALRGLRDRADIVFETRFTACN